MRGLCRRKELKNVIAVGKWIRFSEWLLCTFEMNAHPANFVACKMLQWMRATLLYFPMDATAFELIAWWILMCLKKFLITLHSLGSDVDGGGGGGGVASTHKQQQQRKKNVYCDSILLHLAVESVFRLACTAKNSVVVICDSILKHKTRLMSEMFMFAQY